MRWVLSQMSQVLSQMSRVLIQEWQPLNQHKGGSARGRGSATSAGGLLLPKLPPRAQFGRRAGRERRCRICGRRGWQVDPHGLLLRARIGRTERGAAGGLHQRRGRCRVWRWWLVFLAHKAARGLTDGGAGGGRSCPVRFKPGVMLPISALDRMLSTVLREILGGLSLNRN